jgi:hypothetical protein
MFSFEVYKKDNRCKGGSKLVEKFDSEEFETMEVAQEFVVKTYTDPKVAVTIHKTMVEKINHISGKPFMERYDVPYHCSPSSETYWSS